MVDLKFVELGDIAEVTMGQSPKSEYYNTDKEGLPFLQGNKTFGFKYPSFDMYTSSITKIAKKDSILMSVRAPVGDLNIASEDLCIGRGLCSLNMKNDNNNFLYYLLKFNLPNLLNRESGTVFGSINKKDIETLEVAIPKEESIQYKIVDILLSIDNLIIILKKINHNLEKMVNNLFNYYFIKFEPFKKNEYINSKLGNIPKGWKISELGEYCKLKSGFAFKSAWWQESGIKIIKIKNIKQGKIDLSDCSFVSFDKITDASEFLVKEGDLIIAMTGATLGKFSIVPKHDEPLYINQRVGKFFLGEKPLLKLPFLWGLLNQKRIFDEIIKRGQGSAQPNISPKDIESIPIIYPPKNIIDKFNDKCIPLFKLMITNSYEIEKLTRIRDILLPKLMSGEIDVSNIEV